MAWFKKRTIAFFYAFRGSYYWFQETHSKIHLIAAVLAVLLSVYLEIKATEWCFIIFSISLVFFAEAINTAIEAIADRVESNHHVLVQKSKDVAAFAVLITAINAVLVGFIVWWPYLSKILTT